jgi:hypothetical protein
MAVDIVVTDEVEETAYFPDSKGNIANRKSPLS